MNNVSFKVLYNTLIWPLDDVLPSLQEIKKKIEQKIGLEVVNQRIFYQRYELNDDSLLDIDFKTDIILVLHDMTYSEDNTIETIEERPPLFKWLSKLKTMSKEEKIRAISMKINKIHKGNGKTWRGSTKVGLMDSLTLMMISEKKIEKVKELMKREENWELFNYIDEFITQRRKTLNDVRIKNILVVFKSWAEQEKRKIRILKEAIRKSLREEWDDKKEFIVKANDITVKMSKEGVVCDDNLEEYIRPQSWADFANDYWRLSNKDGDISFIKRICTRCGAIFNAKYATCWQCAECISKLGIVEFIKDDVDASNEVVKDNWSSGIEEDLPDNTFDRNNMDIIDFDKDAEKNMDKDDMDIEKVIDEIFEKIFKSKPRPIQSLAEAFIKYDSHIIDALRAASGIYEEIVSVYSNIKKRNAIARMIKFNIADEKNELLRERILSGEISYAVLISMSSQELANPELKKKRIEREIERKNGYSISFKAKMPCKCKKCVNNRIDSDI